MIYNNLASQNSGNNCCNNNCGCQDSCVTDILCANLGRVVTVFTTGSGCDNGFTGLCTMVNEDCCKLVTCIPSAPAVPKFRCGEFNLCCNNNPSRYGSAIVIPTCKISGVVVVEV